MDRLAVGADGLDSFVLEVGGMDYGFEIGGILGTDFLVAAGAVVNLRNLEITFAAGNG